MADSPRGAPGSAQDAAIPPGMIEIGYVRRAHGLRGQLLVRTWNASSETLAPGVAVVMQGESGLSPHVVREVAPAGVDLRLSLAGIGDRSAAEALQGSRILVEAASLPEPEPGEFYHHQLLGLEARDEAGGELGRLTDILESPAHDIYVIERPGHGELLVPAVGAYVREINVQGGYLVLSGVDSLIEGLGDEPGA